MADGSERTPAEIVRAVTAGGNPFNVTVSDAFLECADAWDREQKLRAWLDTAPFNENFSENQDAAWISAMKSVCRVLGIEWDDEKWGQQP